MPTGWKSLPTEEEWQRAAYGKNAKDSTERTYPWGSDWSNDRGNERTSASFGNFDFNYWNPTPVNAFPQGQSAFGVWDMLGKRMGVDVEPIRSVRWL